MNNILIWVTFVGYCMFVVNSITNMIVLRHTRKGDYQQSEYTFSTIYLVLSVMFAVLMMKSYMNKEEQMVNTQTKELHAKVGDIIIEKELGKYDTIPIFTLEKK